MRILTLDIETSPHKAWAFNVWQQNISHGQIISPTIMLSWAAKWKGSKATMYRKHDDADCLTLLHDLLNEADIVIHYNGDKFDLPHINREFLGAGLPPTRPCASVDMLKVVKQRFRFPHNKLDYVASVVLGEKKLETGGFDLWPAFMSGDKKALATMKKYNIKDVVLTEKLYVALLPWVRNHPYVGLIDVDLGDDDVGYRCPACDSLRTTKQRPRRTRCFAIRTVECRECGTWSEGRRRKVQ